MLNYFCPFLGAAKLVVAVAVFLLTFYVISQVFEIKMDASLGNLFGKFHFFLPLLSLTFDWLSIHVYRLSALSHSAV